MVTELFRTLSESSLLINRKCQIQMNSVIYRSITCMCDVLTGSCRITGGSREAAPCIEERHLQPDLHLWANGGGCVLRDELERESLWPRASHLPLGPDGAGFLLSRGGDYVLLFTQVWVHE